MRRLLGLLSLPLALFALVAPMVASSSAASSLAAAPSSAVVPAALAPVAKVGVRDIEARARRVIGLANRSANPARLAELRTLADADTVAFLRDRAAWTPETPDCKVSAVSSPDSTVYVCRIKEFRQTHRWWLYFRQVEGRWTAVNHRIASSATAFRDEQAVQRVRDRLVSLALAGDAAGLAQDAEPAAVTFLQRQAARINNPDVYGIGYKFDTVSRCQPSKPGTKGARYGAYTCHVGSYCIDDCESYALGFKAVDGRWIATGAYRQY